MKNLFAEVESQREKQKIILSTLSSLPGLLDPEQCTSWLLEKIHPDGPVCSSCGTPLHEKHFPRYKMLRRVLCSACGQQFNAWTGTFLQGTQTSPHAFVLVRVALAAGLNPAGIMKLTGRRQQFVDTCSKKILQFHEIFGESGGE